MKEKQEILALKKEVSELKTQVASLQTGNAHITQLFLNFRADTEARIATLKTDILLKK
ncbi:hypothetical protein ACXJ5A_08530 [Leuconostoc mesenteroides]|uniref:hypothetical protein n=1 Tax=Leuconostoc TaxID=1243 RepID=UPI0039BD6487